jgi:RHS repeat-associated protein
VSYLTTDQLGSPRINPNADGTVMARHDYQPFGEEINRPSYGADEVRKQFTGYERDEETDLDFAQARYYARNHGRFNSTDPIYIKANRLTNSQRLNLYAYVRNNPFKFVDLTGEDCRLGRCKIIS